MMGKEVLWTNNIISFIEDSIWFSAFEWNMLCCFDIKTKQLKDYMIWENVKNRIGVSYATTGWGNYVVQVPSRDNMLRMVDSQHNVIEYSISDAADTREKYCYSVCLGDTILFFPIEENNVLILSEKGVEKRTFNISGICCVSQKEDEVLLANNSDTIWQFDQKKLMAQSFLRIENEKIAWCICYNDGVIIGTCSGKVLYEKEGEQKQLLCIDQKNDCFSSGIVVSNKLILFPYADGNNVYCYDLRNGEINMIGISDDSYTAEWEYNSFGCPVLLDDCVYVMSPKHRALIEIDANGNLVGRHQLCFEAKKEFPNPFLEQMAKCNEIYDESQLTTLEDFMEYLRRV